MATEITEDCYYYAVRSGVCTGGLVTLWHTVSEEEIHRVTNSQVRPFACRREVDEFCREENRQLREIWDRPEVSFGY